VDLIDPSPYQPRTRFREEHLEELARSIRTSGVIQPLVLRPMGARFQLIAGERRWRAAQRAGLHKVPAVVREVSDAAALELTLVENIQREDLNPIDEARAFARLMSEFQLTQDDVAERTGKDRATVANSVRLLKLETPIQEMVEDGKLTAGHGRGLLAISDPRLRMDLARRAAKGGVTVRQIERIASKKEKPTTIRGAARLDANIQAAVEELQRELGTKVRVRPRTARKAGELIIEYYTDSQLADLYDRIARK
jgi:ParB family chromosome partitioning protein